MREQTHFPAACSAPHSRCIWAVAHASHSVHGESEWCGSDALVQQWWVPHVLLEGVVGSAFIKNSFLQDMQLLCSCALQRCRHTGIVPACLLIQCASVYLHCMCHQPFFMGSQKAAGLIYNSILGCAVTLLSTRHPALACRSAAVSAFEFDGWQCVRAHASALPRMCMTVQPSLSARQCTNKKHCACYFG